MNVSGRIDEHTGQTLTSSLKQVFASPTFLGSPLFTVLDELQVALNAPRLDARVIGKADPISSAIKRERDEDDCCRTWEPCTPSSVANGMKWWLENTGDHIPVTSTVRKALSASNRRLILEFDPPHKFQEKDSSLEGITLWISPDLLPDNGSPSLAAEMARIVSVIDVALQIGRTFTPREDPFEEIGYAFNLDELTDSAEARISLAKAFERFDKGLKGLITSRHPEMEAMIKSDFLNQFYWVTQQHGPSSAQVMPIFWERQRSRLLEDLPNLPGAEGEKARVQLQTDAAWVTKYDSRSLFSARPADTGLSLYVEGWTQYVLWDRSDELRRLFFALTTKAQKAAAQKAELATGQLNLFSVPVLVGSRPLFVVQMSLPALSIPVGWELRTELAAHIRELGGIMHWEAQLYRLRKQGKQEQDVERRLSNASAHMLVNYVVNQVGGHIPSGIMSPLKDALDKANTRGEDSCELPRKVLEGVLATYESVKENAKELLQRYKLEQGAQAIDLIPVLSAAIPELHRDKTEVEADMDFPWRVKGDRETLILALTVIVETVCNECLADGVLKIKLAADFDRSTRGNVEIQFLANLASQNGAKNFEDNERIKLVTLGLKSMQGRLEFDRPVRNSNQNESGHAHCVVVLPLFRKQASAHASTSASQ